MKTPPFKIENCTAYGSSTLSLDGWKPRLTVLEFYRAVCILKYADSAGGVSFPDWCPAWQNPGCRHLLEKELRARGFVRITTEDSPLVIFGKQVKETPGPKSWGAANYLRGFAVALAAYLCCLLLLIYFDPWSMSP